MIRNNLSPTKPEIPYIRFEPFKDWSRSIAITFEVGFALTDLFVVIRSYADSLVITPIQLIIMIVDSSEEGRVFFTEALPIYKLRKMSLLDFSVWYNWRWEKDAKYVGHEFFAHKLIFKYSSAKYDLVYPVFPWKDEILEEVLPSSFTEQEEKIKILLKKIKFLEDELRKYKK